jgi:chromate transporter
MAIDLPAEASPPIGRASLPVLFWEFFKIALLGAGGGIVLAHRTAVERRRWMSETEFADMLTLCQFMPGPNVIGIAVCIGAKTRGLLGTLTALSGFVLLPGTIGFSIALLYLGQTRIPAAENILRRVSAAAAGLMIATGLRMLKPRRRDPLAVGFAALAFAGLAIAKLPLLLVLAALAPLSMGAAMLGRRRAR